MTGAVLGIMLSTSSPFAYSATNGKDTNMSKLVRPVVFPQVCKVKQSGQRSKNETNFSTFKKSKISIPKFKNYKI